MGSKQRRSAVPLKKAAATSANVVSSGEPRPQEGGEKVAATPQRYLSKRPPTQSAAALWGWVKTAASNFDRINGTTWASSFAYYAFFALIPLLLLLLTVGTDVMINFLGPSAKDTVLNYIISNVPLSGQSQMVVAQTLQGIIKSRGQIGVAALVVLLWSASSFFQSLVSAVNAAWGNPPLNWWKLPLKSLLMLAVLASALALGILLPALLRIAQNFLSWGGPWVSAVFGVLVVLVPIVVLFYGFLLFYKLAPRRRVGVTFSMVWVPALLVTGLLQVCQQLLVLYSTRITDFNAVYGAFGGVIAVMLWAYLSGLVIVFGGCLCAAQREMRATPEGPVEPVGDESKSAVSVA